jgi:hypothetical protein
MDYPYKASDVQIILERALARQHHHEFSEAQLLEMSQEMGIAPDTLEQAKLDWLADRQDAELRQSLFIVV